MSHAPLELTAAPVRVLLPGTWAPVTGAPGAAKRLWPLKRHHPQRLVLALRAGQSMRILRRRMRPEEVASATAAVAPRTVRPDKPQPAQAATH